MQPFSPDLPKTGIPNGSPVGGPKEKKLDRSLRRQYQASDFLAQQGYHVINNPKTDPPKDKVRANADPDFRIEGIIFDCYTPDPPLQAQHKARQDVFGLTEPSSEFDFSWDDDPQVQSQIDTKTKSLVCDSIRKQVMGKIHDAQAFSIVLNLTDVCKTVTSEEVGKMLKDRGVEKLERVLIVAPREGAIPTTPCVNKEQFRLDDVSYDVYEEPEYALADLTVTDVKL